MIMVANKKEVYKSPNQEAIERYEREIAYWEKKYDEANRNHDWSARNEAGTNLYIKRTNLAVLKEKVCKKVK